MQDLEFRLSDFTDQADVNRDVNSNSDSFVTKYTDVVNRHAPISLSHQRQPGSFHDKGTSQFHQLKTLTDRP